MNASLAGSDVADATQFRAAVARALRELPSDVLRKLAASWPAEGDPVRLLAEAAHASDLVITSRPGRVGVPTPT